MVDICNLDSASDVADFGSHGTFDNGPIIQKWHLLVRDSMSTPCGALFHAAQILKNAEDSCRTSNIVDWVAESHYMSMRYGGQLISIGDIGDAYYCAVADITVAMAPELAHFTEAQLAKLSVCKDIAENCINDTMGYSFLANKRNDYAALYDSHLVCAKLNNGDFTYEGAAGIAELDRAAMREWLGRMDALLDTIAFAIHISGGQPARAPELASIMLRNDQISRRGIFAKRDTLCLVTTYWKGQSIYQSQREVARYLPKELAQLVLQYLVLIRPCICQVTMILLANDVAEQQAIARVYDNYLFACNGQPTTAVHLRQSFACHWALYTKYDVNFQDYCQFSRAFIINLCHEGKEENMQLISSDGDSEDISPSDFVVDLANLHGQQLMDTSIDFQAGHSNNIAERVYGRSNETMATISSLVDLQFFIISGLWHSLLRKYHMSALSVVPAIISNKRTADFDLTRAPAAKRTITEAADSGATHHTTIIQF
ncbi:hypothetical protein GGF42_008683 [Coemansia sp. RSA 2424]|nr:hypothetical protein GGF42_008683 [Coemansia sp. RSA 2424]